GRDVRRWQWLKRPRIVPVEQVSVVPLQARQGRENALGPVGQLEESDVSEVVSGQIGEKLETDVGRRRSMGDDRSGILLEIVRREVISLCGDEGLEEVPVGAGEATQEAAIDRKKGGRRPGRGSIEPGGNGRRG